MHQLNNYDVYIFDCDGVIFDTNELKIKAMKTTLQEHISNLKEINECIDYFSNNFGMSRYHHIDHFVDNIITMNASNRSALVNSMLEGFGLQCQKLYHQAEFTPGFLDFIKKLQGDKYVASGSLECELRNIFESRGISYLFEGIFGSPIKKSDLVKHILTKHSGKSVVMFGDALSDLEASKVNGIDFVAYMPFSNVKDALSKESTKNNYLSIDGWTELV